MLDTTNDPSGVMTFAVMAKIGDFFILPSPQLFKNGSRKNWEPKDQVTVA